MMFQCRHWLLDLTLVTSMLQFDAGSSCATDLGDVVPSVDGYGDVSTCHLMS